MKAKIVILEDRDFLAKTNLFGVGLYSPCSFVLALFRPSEKATQMNRDCIAIFLYIDLKTLAYSTIVDHRAKDGPPAINGPKNPKIYSGPL